MLRYLILGLLRGGERVHGYGLWKSYERRSGRLIQNGKFYRALKGLTAANLIRPLAHTDDDPRRTPYEITMLGRTAFDDWVVAFDSIGNAGEDEISSRALFIFELPPNVAGAFFAGVEDVLSARWKRLEYERERTLSRPGINDRDRFAQSLLLARSLERTSADLSWVREARTTYERLRTERLPSATSTSPRSRATGRAQR